jgi:hypothetical protein
MAKVGFTVKELRFERKALSKKNAELARRRDELSDEVASLEKERGLRLEIRGMHNDVDSMKHMVRGVQNQFGVFLDLFATKYDLRPKRDPIDVVLEGNPNVDLTGQFKGLFGG